MNFIESLVSVDIVHAIGWTLIHSIWQILLIGLCLKILVFLYKNLSANSRYWLSASALILIIAVSVMTFFIYYSSENGIGYAKDFPFHEEFNAIQISHLDPAGFSSGLNQSILAIISQFISSNINVIVSFWLVGLLFFYIRFAGSYWYIHRLKNRNLHPLNNEWKSILHDLKYKLRINKVIRLAESTVIRIPMVIGHLKPIILLPVGMLTALPYDQVEAIITHELAHIKRNDYLINLIKSFFEVIFFYHPVAWWISSMMDDERENCCDDLTIKICGESSSLQNALLNLQELNQKPTYIAAALFKNNHQLLKRIKRMKTIKKTTHGKISGLAGILILLAGVAIMTTFSAFSPTSTDLPAEFQSYENPASVTLLSTTGDQYSEENSRVIIEDQKTDIIQSFPTPDSTKKVKKEKNIDTDVDIDADVDADVDVDMDKDIDKEKELQKELERAQVNMDKASKAYNKAMVDYYEAMAKTKDLKDIEAWTIAEGEYAKALALAELYIDNIDFDIPDFQEQFSAEMLEGIFEEFEKWSIDEQFDISFDLYEDALKLHEIEEALMEVEMIEQFKLIEDHLADQFELIEDNLADQIEELKNIRLLEMEAQILESRIKSELIKDGLINNETDDLSFRLSAKKLEVNGKKQQPEFHQKYLELYENLTGEKLEGTTTLIFED